MSTELKMIVSIVVGVSLYTLGGYKWKFLRREVLPIIWGLLLLSLGVHIWKCITYIILQDIVFRLPYGESRPYWFKGLVGVAFVLPTLLFGFTLWQLITPLVFISMFALSNWMHTSNDFTWKICEGSVGFCMGCVIAVLLTGV